MQAVSGASGGISIHAPLTGCDPSKEDSHHLIFIISIHAPLTGCDKIRSLFSSVPSNFNPRTPYGMRHVCAIFVVLQSYISIHAPLTGCDDENSKQIYPTTYISIHAPLTGCDEDSKEFRRFLEEFQSTHPLRDATLSTISLTFSSKFQSTHPLRDATLQEKGTVRKL